MKEESKMEGIIEMEDSMTIREGIMLILMIAASIALIIVTKLIINVL